MGLTANGELNDLAFYVLDPVARGKYGIRAWLRFKDDMLMVVDASDPDHFGTIRSFWSQLTRKASNCTLEVVRNTNARSPHFQAASIIEFRMFPERFGV